VQPIGRSRRLTCKYGRRRFGLPSRLQAFYPHISKSRSVFAELFQRILWRFCGISKGYTIGKPKKFAFQIFDVSEGSKSPSRAAKPNRRSSKGRESTVARIVFLRKRNRGAHSQGICARGVAVLRQSCIVKPDEPRPRRRIPKPSMPDVRGRQGLCRYRRKISANVPRFRNLSPAVRQREALPRPARLALATKAVTIFAPARADDPRTVRSDS
jgi:hypothetical protein